MSRYSLLIDVLIDVLVATVKAYRYYVQIIHFAWFSIQNDIAFVASIGSVYAQNSRCLCMLKIQDFRPGVQPYQSESRLSLSSDLPAPALPFPLPASPLLVGAIVDDVLED